MARIAVHYLRRAAFFSAFLLVVGVAEYLIIMQLHGHIYQNEDRLSEQALTITRVELADLKGWHSKTWQNWKRQQSQMQYQQQQVEKHWGDPRLSIKDLREDRLNNFRQRDSPFLKEANVAKQKDLLSPLIGKNLQPPRELDMPDHLAHRGEHGLEPATGVKGIQDGKQGLRGGGNSELGQYLNGEYDAGHQFLDLVRRRYVLGEGRPWRAGKVEEEAATVWGDPFARSQGVKES